MNTRRLRNADERGVEHGSLTAARVVQQRSQNQHASEGVPMREHGQVTRRVALNDTCDLAPCLQHESCTEIDGQRVPGEDTPHQP